MSTLIFAVFGSSDGQTSSADNNKDNEIVSLIADNLSLSEHVLMKIYHCTFRAEIYERPFLLEKISIFSSKFLMTFCYFLHGSSLQK